MRRPTLLVAALAALLLAPSAARAEDADLAPKLRAALVRLAVTGQRYETSAPWKLGRAYTRSGVLPLSGRKHVPMPETLAPQWLLH